MLCWIFSYFSFLVLWIAVCTQSLSKSVQNSLNEYQITVYINNLKSHIFISLCFHSFHYFLICYKTNDIFLFSFKNGSSFKEIKQGGNTVFLYIYLPTFLSFHTFLFPSYRSECLSGVTWHVYLYRSLSAFICLKMSLFGLEFLKTHFSLYILF